MIKSNIRPFQNSAPFNPTVGASPYTYTNTSGMLQYVFVTGGLLVTASLFGLSGLSLSAGAAYLLRPGDTFGLTFTGAPTLTVVNLF